MARFDGVEREGRAARGGAGPGSRVRLPGRNARRSTVVLAALGALVACGPDGTARRDREGGGGPRELTTWPASESNPRISPDGSTLAFDAVRDGVALVFLMELETGQVRAITDGSSNDRRPAWSPDGTRIAYISDASGSTALWTMRPDGGERRLLFEDGGLPLSGPDWSPDGLRIAVSRVDASRPGNAGYGRATVLVIDAAEGSATERTSEGDEWWPKWSADGQWLYYYKGLTDDLEAVHRSTGEVRPVRSDGLIGWLPAASPRGDLVAYVSDVAGYGLWVSGLGTSRADVRLLESGEPDMPSFTPDGSAVVATLDTTTTFVVRLSLDDASRDTIGPGRTPEALPGGVVAHLPDGARRSFVLLGGAQVADTIRTPLEYLTDFSFSPGGTYLAVAAPGEMDARHDVHLLAADGSHLRQLSQVGDAFRYVTWCDDGRTLLYSSKSDRRVNTFRHLWSVDVESGTTTRLTEPGGDHQAPTDCDRDGARITFQHTILGGGLHVLEGAPGGLGDRRASGAAPGRSDDPAADPGVRTAVPGLGTATEGRWSPDGSRLLHLDRVEGRVDLFVLEPDGTRTRLTDDEAVESDPSWSPDGHAVVFAVRRPNRGIWLIPVG